MKPIFSIIIFCISLAGFGQNYFNINFDFNVPDGWDGALNVLEVDDEYIICGGTGHSESHNWNSLGMTKLNHQGEIVWKKVWEDSTSRLYYTGRGSLLKHGESYFTVGSRNTYYESGIHYEMMLIKYDANFDTLWSAYYGEKTAPYDTGYIPRNFAKIEDGFIVTGTKYPDNGDDSQVFLLKTDSLGNPLWEQNFGSSDFHDLGYSVITTSDGGYAIGGYKFVFGPFGTSIGDPIVIKTDSLGNFEWEMNLGGPYQDGMALVCNIGDGNIVVASRFDIDSIHQSSYESRVQITKIDNSGDIIWSNLHGDISKHLTIYNLRPINENGFIISGYLWPPPEREKGFLFRFNSLGDSIWYRQYSSLNGQENLNFFCDAIPTTDGGFLAGGYCVPVNTETGSQDAWAIKVDSLGCESPWDCWVDIEEIDNYLPPTTDNFIIYPNPVDSKFTINIGKITSGQISISVFNLYGIKIQEVKIPKGQEEIRLDSSGWQNGIYIAVVLGNNKLLGKKKFIVQNR